MLGVRGRSHPEKPNPSLCHPCHPQAGCPVAVRVLKVKGLCASPSRRLIPQRPHLRPSFHCWLMQGLKRGVILSPSLSTPSSLSLSFPSSLPTRKTCWAALAAPCWPPCPHGPSSTGWLSLPVQLAPIPDAALSFHLPLANGTSKEPTWRLDPDSGWAEGVTPLAPGAPSWTSSALPVSWPFWGQSYKGQNFPLVAPALATWAPQSLSGPGSPGQRPGLGRCCL